MSNTLHKIVENIRSNRERHRKIVSVLLVLSVIVAIGVIWRLKLTGITMTDEAYCGIEEHHHTDECTQPGETEITRTLTCTLNEHVHTDDCYTIEKVLVCTQEHEHIDDCYEEKKVLTCTLQEHTHTDSCYEITSSPKYICGKTEHTHTLQCYSNPNSDTETAEIWELTLPKLGSIRADNIIAVALSQRSYEESKLNYHIAEDKVTKKGYSRYGAWYGNPYGDWNTMFSSFCVHYANVPEEVFPTAAGAYAWSVKLTEKGLYSSAQVYTPKAGDIIFFDTTNSGQPNMTAVVTEVNDTDGIIKVVIGDSEDKVAEKEYQLSDMTITGYGCIPPLAEGAEPDPSAATTLSDKDDAGIEVIVDDNENNSASTSEIIQRPGFNTQIDLDNDGINDTIDLAGNLSAAKLFIGDTEILNWADGSTPITVHEKQDCKFILSFYLGNAVKTGDAYRYTYQVPKNILNAIIVKPQENMALYGTVGSDESGQGGTTIYMGRYSLTEDGIAVFELDETFADSYVDIKIDDFEIGFEWKPNMGTNPITLTIDEDYKFILNVIRESTLLTEKEMTRVSSDPMTAMFTVNVKAFGDTARVSATDELSGTYTYTDSNNVSHTIPVLEYRAGDQVSFQVLNIYSDPKNLTGYSNVDPNDPTTVIYTVTAADAAAGKLLNLPSFDLTGGDTLTFTYPAHITNSAAIQADISAVTIYGKNNVCASVNGTDDEYPAAASFSYAGKNSKLLNKSGIMSDTGKSVTWTIEVNGNATYNVNGLHVFDYIDEFQSYDTSSPLILKTYSANGTCLSTLNYNIANYIAADGRSWEFPITDTEAHRYTITYNTLVNDNYTGAQALKNGTNGRLLDRWYYNPSGVYPGGQSSEVGKRDYEYTKTAVSPEYGDETINWTSTFQVNPGSVSPQYILVCDNLPTYTDITGRKNVLQLVDKSGNVLDLTNNKTYNAADIIDVTVYKLNNGILNYDSNGNITNEKLIISGFNDGATPMKIGAYQQNNIIQDKNSGFRITKTGFAPASPESASTLDACGYTLPGAYGDYADGYCIVLNYATTSDIDTAPEGIVLSNEIMYYYGPVGNHGNSCKTTAVAVLPIKQEASSINVDKKDTWYPEKDAIHYEVKINDGMTNFIDGDKMTWVDTYDENLEPTGNITLLFAKNYTCFPVTGNNTSIKKGKPLVKEGSNYSIPVNGFIETSAGSGIYEYIFTRKTHCGDIATGSTKNITVTITHNKNDRTITYEFSDIPTDNASGLQQQWKILYDMKINDPDASFYGPQTLDNTFEVYGKSASHSVGASTTTTSVVRKQVSKSCVEDGTRLFFSVKVDYNETIKNFTQLTFSDKMNEHLDLTFSSVAVKFEKEDGTLLDIQSVGGKVTKNFASGTGVLSVTVDAGADGDTFEKAFGSIDVDKIVLSYECSVVGGKIGEEVAINNSITVNGLTYGTDEYEDVVVVPFVNAIGSATPLLFSVYKIDGNVVVGGGEIPLANSVFTLYDMTDPDNPVAIATRTTAADGTSVFRSMDIVAEGKGYSLSTMTPYRLIETSAPTGYVRTSAPKDFYIYANSDLTNGKLNLTPAQQALLDGYTAYYISSESSVNFTFTNVQTSSFDIAKTNAVTGALILSDDAVFTLYHNERCTDEYVSARITDGTATFVQLIPGTYYLKETEAPQGYLLFDGVLTVTVSQQDASGNVTITITGTNAKGETVNEYFESGGTLTFPDEPFYDIVATGGTGTAIFYITGTVLMLGAGIMLITRKKLSRAHS